MHSVLINERVHNIKGDMQKINQLVEEYKPFIASCIEKITGRYMRYGEDDELSVGLMAFVEAIESFDKSKGNFLSFAQNVIKRRVIDYYRKEKKHSNVIHIGDYTKDAEDTNTELDISIRHSIQEHSEKELSDYRRMELEELKRELAEWDISFFELAEASPKAEKTKVAYRSIIKYILAQPEMLEFIKIKRYLPVAEIQKGTGIPRKKIERARKYIIAVLVINTGDYHYIQDYVSFM
jgi:RNA polymerase sigma factor